MTNRITPFFLLAFTLFFAQYLAGQIPNYQWVENGGGSSSNEYIVSVSAGPNGNLYALEWFSLSNVGMRIRLYDPTGMLIWTKSIQGSGWVNPSGIEVDALGNAYIAGYFNQTADFDPGAATHNESTGNASFDAFVLKLNPNGDFVWVKVLSSPGNDYAYEIALSPNSDLFIVGAARNAPDFDPGPSTYYLPFGGSSDAFVWVLDTAGSFVGGYCSNDPDNINILGIDFGAQKDVFLTGYYSGTVDLDFTSPGTQSTAALGATDFYVSHYDSAMNLLWAKSVASSGGEAGFRVATDNFGNVYGLGEFSASTLDVDPGSGSTFLSNSGGDDILIFKWDSSGNFIWARNFGSPTVEQYGYDINVDALGNCYVTGGFRGSVDFSTDSVPNILSAVGGMDIFILCLNSAGLFEWVIQLGGSDYDSGNSCTLSNDGSNLFIGGQFRNTVDFDPGPGTAFRSSIGGADFFILDLGVCQPSPTTVMTDSACGSYTWYGQTYSSSGTYSHALTNAAGCDSTLQLDLTILQPTAETLNESACDSYTLNGQTYSSSGTYTQTLSNSAGCDSVITLNLTVNTATAETLNESTCDNYSLNGQTYYSSGTYTQTLANMAGCDSVITLNLTVITVDTSVSTLTQGLSANATGATYQWLDCDNSMAAISGQSNQFFFPTQDGNYAVSVTQNGCTDTSACHEVLLTALEPGLNASHITLTPNPTEDGRIKVSLQGGLAFDEVEILDLQGRVLRVHSITNQAEFQLELPGTAGMYILRFKDEKHSVSIRASRL